MQSTNEIRSAFLEYFREREHEVVASSPLVPANDPTLLFTNAGMVQFKEVFLGIEKRAIPRATSAQRCVRAGGKHNDLENVGYTARHHTFFEMLGNFSFGDYFKREAINYAWEFLTVVMQIPGEKLWVTVYKDDDEAADIWLQEIGIDPGRLARCGEADNFWSMGDTGPCGPCSEIFYDHGEAIAGGPPGSPDADGDRYIEIWNLVFTQYNRDKDGTLNPIPRPSVDTGMGLERLAAVMQGVHNNYDIDLFRRLIGAVRDLLGKDSDDIQSMRVIADHIRSCAFMVVDGVVPSNEGRGYVLRRIIRRAIRHGHKLGLQDVFFYKLVDALAQEMGDAYPELLKSAAVVKKVLRQEEERFSETLDQGLKLLEQAIADLSGKTIAGDTIFRLYDTYGFPVDLTADIARERGLDLDMPGFDRAMGEQRKRGRAASRFEADWSSDDLGIDAVTEFTGYEHLAESAAQVVALIADGQIVEQIQAGQSGAVVLDVTPFYAESGGQVGDQGRIEFDGGVFTVADTRKEGKAHVHFGMLESGTLANGAAVRPAVEPSIRHDTIRNHSATHLLHAALRRVLGEHVTQKGSLVAPERLRFDFSHFEPVTDEQLGVIEQMVNEQVMENHAAETRLMDLDEARQSGAMALFGEKYAEQVRVLSLGEFSTELCGGTHVSRTGDIGLFKIVAETGIAAGVRRVEAVTGRGAMQWVRDSDQQLQRLAGLLKTERGAIDGRVTQIMEQGRALEKELRSLKGKLASSQGGELSGQAVEIGGIRVLAAQLDNADVKTLRDTVDQLKNKLGTAAIVLASVGDQDKVSVIAGVTADATDRIKAGALVNFVASQIGGKGGGRPDMAQAGGNDPAALAAALDGVCAWVAEQL